MKKIHPYTLLGIFYTVRIGVIIWASFAYGWQLGVILFLTVVANEMIGKR